MSAMIFFNIGWMERYRGASPEDEITGGGAWVRQHHHGGEVCNFLTANDGLVYGHVETSQNRKTGEIDRKIRLENFGGGKGSSAILDVVWTATDPKSGGRRVVGWYQDAEVFRERQFFGSFPSAQHRKERISSFRAIASAKKVHLLSLKERDDYELGSGKHWMGHTQWWAPDSESPSDVRAFERKIKKLIRREGNRAPTSRRKDAKSNSPSAAKTPHSRYVETFECKITPRHHNLQLKFEDYLQSYTNADVRPNIASVDVSYNGARGKVLAEIKPCDPSSVRFAIRSAMGQLLDYKQRHKGRVRLLIVVETKPNRENLDLALTNGFGIAYPTKKSFEEIWP